MSGYMLVFVAILVLPPLTVGIAKGLARVLVLTGTADRLLGADPRTDEAIRKEQAKGLLYGYPEDEVEFSPSNCDI